MLLNSGSGALSRNAAGSKEDLHAQDSRCSSKYNKIFISIRRYIHILESHQFKYQNETIMKICSYITS